MSNLSDMPRAASVQPTSLDHYLVPLRSLLEDPSVTEICINRPGEAWVERASFTLERLPFATFEWCRQLAVLVAGHTKQTVDAAHPLLSGTLPGGQRIQFVLPPAADAGSVSITIRIPSGDLWTLDQLAARGVMDTVHMVPKTLRAALAKPADPLADDDLPAVDRALLAQLARRDIVGFLRAAVLARKNILLSGGMGSGKTTVSKALILEVPATDRIVTIEDAKELVLANQPNHVRLFYSQGGQGASKMGVRDLLTAVKRMRPTRVFVSELRTGDEAYDYLVSVNAGHPGGITSIHANSCADAFTALAQIIKTGDAGRDMAMAEAVALAKSKVDVVIQCTRGEDGTRRISEIWYDPAAKQAALD